MSITSEIFSHGYHYVYNLLCTVQYKMLVLGEIVFFFCLNQLTDFRQHQHISTFHFWVFKLVIIVKLQYFRRA